MSEARANSNGDLIRLDGVSKAFGDIVVFEDLTLGFRQGDTTVVLGRSGVGKSVLLKLILGLLRPDAGRIFVGDDEVTGRTERHLIPIRTRFGMVFQEAALFDYLTVFENVAFGVREHRRVQAEELADLVAEKLALVGLEGTEDLYPEELSGGMRKRVGFARAIAMDPEVLLYDEPTSGLDPVTGDAINRLILRFRDELGVTGLVVTHDIASAYRVGHHLVLLHEGKVIAAGDPDAFREHGDPRVQAFVEGRSDLAPDDTPSLSGRTDT